MHMLVHQHDLIKGDDKGLAEGPVQAQPGKLGEKLDPVQLCESCTTNTRKHGLLVFLVF